MSDELNEPEFEFEFVNTPGEPRASYDWSRLAAILRQNPDRWIRLKQGTWGKTHASTQARRIRLGSNLVFLPAGSFEATSRNKDLYIRYVRRTQSQS